MERWTAGLVPVLVGEAQSDIVVVLAHGAGSHMEHKTMERLASLVGSTGVSVVRFNFRYRALEKSVPDRMPVLIETFQEVITTVRERISPRVLVAGGHSMGGRAASIMEAESHSADGLLLFGYPLHPAGDPTKLRDQHLPLIRVPSLQINGTQDALCTPSLMADVLSKLDPSLWTMKWIEGADHSYAVKKSSGRTKEDVDEEMRSAVSTWLGGFR